MSTGPRFSLSAYPYGIMKLNTNKLPEYAREILDNYLLNALPYTPPEALLLSLNILCSQVISFNRVKIQLPEIAVPTNIYGITFMDSGSGKDSPFTLMKRDIFIDIFKDIEEREYQFYRAQLDDLENEVLNKDNRSADQYREKHSPRRMIHSAKDCTVQGLYAMREVMETARFGSLHIVISELADYIIAQSQARQDMVAALKDIYDFGDNEATIIKGDKNAKSVKGVPQTFMGHTTLDIVDKNQKGKELLYSFLGGGLSRRSFVCYPQERVKPERNLTDEEILDLEDHRNRERVLWANTFRTMLLESYNETKHSPVLTLSDGALKKYRLYKFKCQTAEVANEESGFSSELHNKFWKMIRLAGIIAVFNHPLKKEIEAEDVEQAIYQTDFYSDQLYQFYHRKNTSLVESIYNYIIANQSKELITKTKLRQFISAKNSLVTDILNQKLQELEEYCVDNDEKLISIKQGRKTLIHIEPITKDDEELEKIKRDLNA